MQPYVKHNQQKLVLLGHSHLLSAFELLCKYMMHPISGVTVISWSRQCDTFHFQFVCQTSVCMSLPQLKKILLLFILTSSSLPSPRVFFRLVFRHHGLSDLFPSADTFCLKLDPSFLCWTWRDLASYSN